MTNAEREHLATLIRQYRKHILAEDTPTEILYELGHAVRDAVNRHGEDVLCDGRLYTARRGNIIMIDLSRVVDLGEAET